MGLIQFMFSRKEEKSPLASRKYGEKEVKPEELDKPLLAHKFPTMEEKSKPKKLGKVCILGRTKYPKIFSEAEEKDL